MSRHWLTAVVFASVVVLTGNQAQAGDLGVWAVGDMVRIDPESGRAFEDNPTQLPKGASGDHRKGNTVWSAVDRTVQLHAARNEVVAFQVIVEGKAARVDVSASPLSGPSGAVIADTQIKLYREWYIWVDQKLGNQTAKGCMLPLGPGWYPEIAIPLDTPGHGGGFAIPSADFHDPSGTKRPRQTNQAIWVDVHVPTEATPGDYNGQITVRADGKTHTVDVRLSVWDVVIPATMHMHAELMTYGRVAKEPDLALMRAIFRLAHEHRTFVSDSKARPPYDGTRYDWQAFDARFGPVLDGSALTEGPCAGRPIPYWTLPIEFNVDRTVDKRASWVFKDWPLPSQRTPSGFGVVFSDAFKQQLRDAIGRYHAHVVDKGWKDTHFYIWQNSLDEPGLHKTGRALKAGAEQVRAIHDTATLVKAMGIAQISYKLDIGSGFINNKLDLDGDGTRHGAYDVANYLGPVVDCW